MKAASQRSYRLLKFSKLEEAITGQLPGSIFDLVMLSPYRFWRTAMSSNVQLSPYAS